MTYNFDNSVLREYDIRGIIGETLAAEDAYNIGRAFASFKPTWQQKAPTIAVGRDGRVSSNMLEEALIKGLRESGANVVSIGLVATPMLYFTVAQGIDAGVMITGSHNPPSHNGFKFMIAGESFYGKDIKKIGEIAAAGAYFSGNGTLTHKNIEEDYLTAILKSYTNKRPLKVVWDCGNGATGEIVEKLVQHIAGENITLFTKIDGSFPNHHPDPSVAKNLQDVIAKVREHQCDIGIAFDGDGDRIGVVDQNGDVIAGDQLVAIFAAEVLSKNPGATIIADVKASETLFAEIKRLGGNPLMWKTGHSLIKAKMKETKALLAGEMSGHIFFADNYFGYDDALYAAVRIISLLAGGDKSLSELRNALPQTFSTSELRIDCPDDRKFAFIEEVQQRLRDAGARFSDIDGVRVMNEDGWWLLRASNTQAALVARCEAADAQGLKNLEAQLNAQLELL